MNWTQFVHRDDMRKIIALFDRVTALEGDDGTTKSTLDRIEYLERWRNGIRVEGAAYFSNSSIGMQIVIPRPPRQIPQIQAGDSLVFVKLTANRTDGGEYDGEIGTGTMTSTAGDLTLPEGMTFTGTANAVICNEDEDGLPTHWLKTPSYATGKVTGTVTTEGSDKGKRIVVITKGVARTADPEDFSTPPSTATDADTRTWNRGAPESSGDDKGDTPILEMFNCRPNEDSEPEDGVITTYSFWRTRTIDASGSQVSLSAETRVAEYTTKAPCAEEE